MEGEANARITGGLGLLKALDSEVTLSHVTKVFKHVFACREMKGPNAMVKKSVHVFILPGRDALKATEVAIELKI